MLSRSKYTLFTESNKRGLDQFAFYHNHPSINGNLQNLKKLIFPTYHVNNSDPDFLSLRKKVHQRLDIEYQVNPFAKNILKWTDYLIACQRLSVLQSDSLLTDIQYHLGKTRTACFTYNERFSRGEIILSSYPSPIFDLYKISLSKRILMGKSANKNIYQTSLGAYVGTLLHEATHAVETLLTNHIVTTNEKEMLAKLELGSNDLIKLLSFNHYEHEELNALSTALKNDILQLFSFIEQGNKLANTIFNHILNIYHIYPKERFLEEMKSHFIEYTTQDAYDLNQAKEYLPNTAAWFFKYFFPHVEKSKLTNDQVADHKFILR